MPGQTLDVGFTAALDDAKTQSQLIGDYIRGKSASSYYYQRHWMIPSRAGSFSPTSIADQGSAFSRFMLNKEYSDNLNNGVTDTTGMMGNIIVDGIQINYMAMLERSFRERHKTDVRLQMHVSGRRIAHGLENGVHTGGVKAFVQSYIDNTRVVPA